MSRTVPWNVKNGEAEPRRSKPDSSEHPVRTVGDWLDSLIEDDRLQKSERATLAESIDQLLAMASKSLTHSSSAAVQNPELAATGTDGPMRRFASGERHSVRVLDGVRDARSSAAEAYGASRTNPGSPPPTTMRGYSKEQSIRDAVAAITRRQQALDSPVPGRAASLESSSTANETKTTEIGVAVAAIETRLASMPVGGGVAQDADRRQQSAAPSRNTLDEESTQAFERLGEDLREVLQSLDQRGHLTNASLNDSVAGGLGTSEDSRLFIQDLLRTTSGAPVVETDSSARPIHFRARPAVGAPGPDGPENERLWSDVRALLTRLGAGSPIDTLDRRLQSLTERLEQHLETSSPSSLIEDLSRRIDVLQATVATPSSNTTGIESLLHGVEERILKARAASADMTTLETMMHGLAERIDASSRQPEPRALTMLEAQVQRLGERLDRSEANLSSLDGIEQSLRNLFSQLEQTRVAAVDAAEQAARTAARDTLRAVMQDTGAAARAPDGRADMADQVTKEVQDLRLRHDASDRRTQAALGGLHQVVEKLVERLVQPVGEEVETRANRRSAASWVKSGETTPVAPDADPRSVEPRATPQMPVTPLVDSLIEPGEGRVSKPNQSPASEASDSAAVRTRSTGVTAPVMTVDSSATFIAAARRAAQAAQASAASRQQDVPAHDGDVASASSLTTSAVAMLNRARGYLAHRRRPILLSLAGIVLMLGALEIVKVEFDAPSEPIMAAASVPPIVGPGEVQPSAALPKASVAATTPPIDSPRADNIAKDTPLALPSARAAGRDPTTDAAETTKPATTVKAINPFLAGLGQGAAGIGDGLKAMAEAGDPAAEYEIGLRYVEGRSVARDPKAAAEWFDKAASHGLAPAQYRLGSAFEKGVGEPRDPAMAIIWYSRAADAGNMRAMHNLAVMSAEGAAGKPDYAKAATLFGKAAALGVRDSQFNLAILYARGLGIEQNLAQSYTWFAIAAAQGDDDAAKKRDEVAARLDAKTLESVKAAATNFRATPSVKAANDVMPPLGGWDAIVPPTKPEAAGGQKSGASKASVM